MKADDRNEGPPLEGVAEQLRTLFCGLLSHFRDKLPSSSLDELHGLVLDALRAMDLTGADIDWDDAAPAALHDCKRQANLHRALRVPATIAEVRDPVVIPVLGERGTVLEVEAMSARFLDPQGQSMWSLNFTGESLIGRVQSQFNRGGMVELLCFPIALPIAIDRRRPAESIATARRGFFLHLADLRASSSALHLIGATTGDRISTARLLATLKKSGVSPGIYLEQLIVQQLNVVGLDTFPLLRTLIRFTVLQALSTGRVDHAPGRLHGLIIGPPAQGKKLLSLAARALNPTCEQVSPTKVSAAGLVGASRHTEDGWVSEPGAIPRASGGVVVLQDAHGWNRSMVARIAPILQEVMEDGVATDAVSGGIKRAAEAALLFDLNRTAHVRPTGDVVPPASEAALLQVRPILSRMDLLCEIPPDVERAWEVARQLYRSMKSGHVPLEDQPWGRTARLVVAELRDRHHDVDLNPVRGLMEDAHSRIERANAQLFNEKPELGDIPARLAISFARYVTAHARARGASRACRADVARSMGFLSMKLAFLAVTGPTWTPMSGSWRGSATEWATRYRGEEVATADVKAAYEQATGRRADERTFRRALINLGGQRRRKGRYLLPP